MENEEFPECHYTGVCETQNNDINDLDMCKYCGALMYWVNDEWVHHSIFIR